MPPSLTGKAEKSSRASSKGLLSGAWPYGRRLIFWFQPNRSTDIHEQTTPREQPHKLLFLFAFIFVFTLASAISCERFPRDSRGSLDRILEQGQLHVGVIHHPPWTFVDPKNPDTPRGVEVDLITVFAHQLGATPVWHVGNESRLFVALENHELDLVIGGIESATPWNSRIALTLIYYIEEADVGSSRAAALPESVDGITVYYRYGSTYRSNLQNQGAIARPLDRLETGHTPLAAPLWLLESMNLAPLGVHLPSSKYVMAIPPGEHALLMSVERFLLDYASKDRVETLLNRHTNK